MSIQTRTRAGALLAFMLCGAQLFAAPPRLAVSVSPRYTFQPGTARVTVVVERNADNRWLVLEADGPDYYLESFREVDGESAPRIQQIPLKALPPGEYAISVTLVRADGSRERAVTTIEVMESAAVYLAASRTSRK